MSFVIDPPKQASVAVAGTDARFPVRRIFCVGRNYAAHAVEMGKDPERDPPFFFTKPADAVVESGETVVYPPETGNFHYEAELIVAIGTGGTAITEDKALEHVWGYAVGNDLTRRDLQLQAREQGRPWDWGKAFDRSAVIGPVHPASEVGHVASGAITLSVNGTEVATGSMESTVAGRFGIDTFGIGEDSGQPVTSAYEPPFKFTGGIESVVVEVQ